MTLIELIIAITSRLNKRSAESSAGGTEFSRGEARAYAEAALFIRDAVRQWALTAPPPTAPPPEPTSTPPPHDAQRRSPRAM